MLLGVVGTAVGCATGATGGGGGDGDSGAGEASTLDGSDGSSSSSDGSVKGWYCGEANGSCQCFTQPVQGTSAVGCTKTYSCCASQPYNGGMTCGCTNTSPCTPANGAKQVPRCPP